MPRDVFDVLSRHRYGELHMATDERTGLKAIVALHNLRLGPGLGGTRCVPYASTDDAILDAVRLARGMSYKAALCGVPHGGGKAVIVRPERIDDRVALFEAFGRFVDGLGGRYITTEDSGTSPADMNVIRTQTRYVVGVSKDQGGSGDPSPWTARGVRRGIEACVKSVLGRDSVDGLHVAIQGVGHVGYHLAKQLHERGATLTVADIDAGNLERAADELGATLVGTDEILAVSCDVLAPCALGAILDDLSIPKLDCRIIGGAANNQLAEARHGNMVAERGITYVPDYAINAGGLISVADEWGGYDEARVAARVDGIYETIAEIVERAQAGGVSTDVVADAMAEQRIFAPDESDA